MLPESEHSKYPTLYEKLFYQGQSKDQKDIQEAWERVDKSWKEIILNLQRTDNSLKLSFPKKQKTYSNDSPKE